MTEKQKLPKWTEERTATLIDMVGADVPVSQELVEELATALDTTAKSVSAKLRKLGYDVEPKATTERAKAFTDEETDLLVGFVNDNPGRYTYKEIAIRLFNDVEKARKVQGKLLSLDLTSMVKPTEKVEATKQYTEQEEVVFEQMALNGAFLEDIAAKLGKSLNSVRGKALAMSRSHGIAIPKQKESYAKASTADVLEGVDVANLTVEEIAEATSHSVRGIKTMLTRRGISAKNYDGAAKAAKAERLKAEAAAA